MLFKRSKKEIPAELPDLTLSDLPQGEEVKIQREFPSQSNQKAKLIYDDKTPEVLDENSSEDGKEEGFFKEVMSGLVNGSNNIEKMESFYNNRFMTEDIVHQMRSYWENKRPELMMKNVGKDLKEKISNETEKLHRLEHEWQDIYFALLTKEEEIRNEEKELKENINEFMSVCKKVYKRKKN